MAQRKDSFQFLKTLAQQPKAVETKGEKIAEAAFLGVMIQQTKYHIPISRIREILPNPQVTPIGHTQDWLLGLVKVQGEIYTVVDITPLLEMPLLSGRGKFAIALSMPEGNYAILVSAVLGITKLSDLKQTATDDDYTITYQTPSEDKMTALSVQSIVEAPALANMSIF
ncbi:MAG: hypothetical protein CSA45_00225 [Gammaproteobacteria bacterium]|nr:MAG: hypothetical protein CSA45_00225 [Gammaproteobacteria bacterium]